MAFGLAIQAQNLALTGELDEARRALDDALMIEHASDNIVAEDGNRGGLGSRRVPDSGQGRPEGGREVRADATGGATDLRRDGGRRGG